MLGPGLSEPISLIPNPQRLIMFSAHLHLSFVVSMSTNLTVCKLLFTISPGALSPEAHKDLPRGSTVAQGHYEFSSRVPSLQTLKEYIQTKI